MAKKQAKRSRWKTKGIKSLIPEKVVESCGDPSCCSVDDSHCQQEQESGTRQIASKGEQGQTEDETSTEKVS